MKRAILLPSTLILQSTFFLLLIAASPSSVPAAQVARRATDAAETHFAAGVAHYNRGQYKEAVASLRQAVAINPAMPFAYYNLGVAYEKSGQYIEALKAFQEAVRLKPTDAKAQSRLGAMQNYFGQNKEAVRSLEQAVKLDPKAAHNYNALGTAYYRLGQYRESVAALEQGISIAPDAATLQNLSAAYLKLNRNKDAATAKQRAANLVARKANTPAATEANIPPAARRTPAPVPTPTNVGFQSATPAPPVTAVSKVEQRPSRRTTAPPSTGQRRAVNATRGARNTSVPTRPPASAAAPRREAERTPAVSTATTAVPETETARVAAPPNAETLTPAPDTSEVELAKTAVADVEIPKREPVAKIETPEVESAKTEAAKTSAAPPSATPDAPTPAGAYRVGVGDVLDIRLLNAPTTGSTLFTVLAGGLIDYPLAGGAIPVGGLQPSDIAGRLAPRIKIYDDPQVVVSVREYASHTVAVSGLVAYPGTKILRHEAVPLYVILADAQPKAEAGRVVISSPAGGESKVIALDEPEAINTLVHPNDVITVQARPTQFYYISGEVKDPGEKVLRSGMTLSQAVLASGVTSRIPTEVEIARQGANGAMVVSRYNLKHVRIGKVPDPRLQPGDWIEVIY